MAKNISIALIAVLFIWGVSLLRIPLVYKITPHNPVFLYRGYLLIALSVFLIWKLDWFESKITWVAEKIHRALSAIAILIALGIDGIMHIFNIPHIEGWWITIVAGSGFISWIHSMLQSSLSRLNMSKKAKR